MAKESPLEHISEIYSPFDAADARRLRVYVDDVETLVASSFFKGPALSLTVGGPDLEGQGISEKLDGPNEEAVRAVAGLFRSLYDDNEPTSYNATLSLLGRNVHEHESPRQRDAKDALRDLRKWKARALLPGGMTIKSNGRELTTVDLIDLFLYGRYLHKDDEKVGTLQDFPLDAVLMFEFMGAVQRLARIFWVGRNVVKPILETPSVLPTPTVASA
jgi:hypothetical protein